MMIMRNNDDDDDNMCWCWVISGLVKKQNLLCSYYPYWIEMAITCGILFQNLKFLLTQVGPWEVFLQEQLQIV